MKSISEQLRTKMLRRPPVVIYPLLGYIWKILYQKKLGFRYEYHVDPRKDKRPHIVLANHTSRLDYIYTGIPLLPHQYSYVAGYNEFFRSHLQGIFSSASDYS